MTAVVISGLGPVAACGCGREQMAAAFEAAIPRFSEIDRSAGYHLERSARRAGLVDGSELGRWLPASATRRLSPSSRFAVVAATLALEDAGLLTDSGRPVVDATLATQGLEAAAVVLSTCYGATASTERILRQVFLEGPGAASPMQFTESVANAPAAQVALRFGARGPNLTVTQREAGPLIAAAQAAALVASGRSPIALAGVAEEMNPLLHAMLDRFQSLSRGASGAGGAVGEELARPFDRDRDGFIAAEGAVIWVLEDEDRLRDRGGRPIARLLFSASAFDPEAPRTAWGRRPDRLADALLHRLERAGIEPSSLDLVISGASGAVGGDRLEALILRRVWGPLPLPPVVTPKALTGEFGGSVLAAGALACLGQRFGATPGFREPDPELGVVPHDGSPLVRPRRVLLTALGAGGSASWMVLEGVES